MSDLSTLSDDDLKALYANSAPAAGGGSGGPLVVNVGGPSQPAPGLSAVSDADLLAMHKSLPPEPGALDTALGYGRALVSGVDKGVAAVAGAPADLGRAAQKAVSWGQSKVQGIPYEEALARNDAKAVISPATLEAWGGEAAHAGSPLAYEPQSGGERLVKEVTSYVPGALLGPGGVARSAASGAIAGLAAEGAGALTAGSGFETPAKIAASVLAPSAARRVFTQPGAARAPFVRTLQDEGVPLTAGDVSGSRVLRHPWPRDDAASRRPHRQRV
jgi:hypothetical protein